MNKIMCGELCVCSIIRLRSLELSFNKLRMKYWITHREQLGLVTFTLEPSRRAHYKILKSTSTFRFVFIRVNLWLNIYFSSIFIRFIQHVLSGVHDVVWVERPFDALHHLEPALHLHGDEFSVTLPGRPMAGSY